MRLKLNLAIFFFAIAFSAVGQVSNTALEEELQSLLSFSVPTITVHEVVAAPNAYMLLDAREYEEYLVSHLPEAVFVGYDNFNISSFHSVPKDQPIVVYCSVGYRSEKIGEKLQRAGFQEVYNLYGSIFEWANCNYPLTNKYQQTTDSVHTYNKRWSRFIHNASITKIW